MNHQTAEIESPGRAQIVKLADRYSGLSVWLRFRAGIVVGALGCEPRRYLGLTECEARHRAQHARKGR